MPPPHREITICDVLAIVMVACDRNGTAKLNGYVTLTATTHPGFAVPAGHPALPPGQVVWTVIAL